MQYTQVPLENLALAGMESTANTRAEKRALQCEPGLCQIVTAACVCQLPSQC